MSLANKISKYEAGPSINGGGRLGGGASIMPPAYGAPPGAFQGDYDQMGDPGIFGFVGKVARGAVGVVSRAGIPVVSGAAGIVGGFLPGGREDIPGATTFPVARLRIPSLRRGAPMAMPGSQRPTFSGLRFGGGVEIGRSVMPTPRVGAPPMAPGGLPATATMGGYHLNKSGYFLMDGTYVAPGTRWVRNRRRNPGNMRALSRSLGRIKSAKRMASTLSRVSIRKKC